MRQKYPNCDQMTLYNIGEIFHIMTNHIKDGAPEKMKLIIIKKLVPFFNEIY